MFRPLPLALRIDAPTVLLIIVLVPAALRTSDVIVMEENSGSIFEHSPGLYSMYFRQMSASLDPSKRTPSLPGNQTKPTPVTRTNTCAPLIWVTPRSWHVTRRCGGIIKRQAIPTNHCFTRVLWWKMPSTVYCMMQTFGISELSNGAFSDACIIDGRCTT
ncbi:hypothetical protein F5888DRAFT_248188 [Russula emetica]|nr:hypothetical protein F5888DRAFT_945922 [Russula emetica]KAF8497734.1 hypothetical protein F5888DRAFT_248188 [Russula emetica]